MVIGIPKEVKTGELRVAMTPGGVRRIVESGSVVLVERGAGTGSGYSDTAYRQAGAKIISSRRDLYRKSDLILKVKEPQPAEVPFLRPGVILFSFLHLAANPRLSHELVRRKVTAIAYETVEGEGGFPLLRPMSEIAGLLAPLIGANYLRKDLGGKGTLLPAVGLGGTGHVTILGAGHVGSNALKIAHGLGASVSLYDINQEKLERLNRLYPERLQVLSDPEELPEVIRRTDLLIGAVLVSGKRAPVVVTKKMVQLMEPGSVVIDVAVDQGGCVETIRPTTLKNPVYKKFEVLHFGVTNIPSLVPRTATDALSAATLPYVLKIAELGLERAIESDPALQKGLNLWMGKKVA